MSAKTISDAKKRRAAELKAQGWTVSAVAQELGLNEPAIENSWRQWAEKFGLEVPKPVEPPYNPPGPVESYRLSGPEEKPAQPLPPAPPLAGLQDKRIPLLSLKQVEDKPVRAAERVERPEAAEKVSNQSPAYRLAQQVNAAFWRYLLATGLTLADVDQKIEIAGGTVSILLAAPAREAGEYEL